MCRIDVTAHAPSEHCLAERGEHRRAWSVRTLVGATSDHTAQPLLTSSSRVARRNRPVNELPERLSGTPLGPPPLLAGASTSAPRAAGCISLRRADTEEAIHALDLTDALRLEGVGRSELLEAEL